MFDISEIPLDISNLDTELDRSFDLSSSIDLRQLDDPNWQDPGLPLPPSPPPAATSRKETPIPFRSPEDLLAARTLSSAIAENPLLVTPDMTEVLKNVDPNKINYNNNYNLIPLSTNDQAKLLFTEVPGTNFLVPNPPDAIAVNTVISERQTKAVKIFRTAQMRREPADTGACRDLLQEATMQITNGWIAAPRHVSGLQEGSSWEQIPPALPLTGQEEAWGILLQNLGRLTPTGHGFSISCPQLAAIFSLPASVSVKYLLLVAFILSNPTFQPAMAVTPLCKHQLHKGLQADQSQNSPGTHMLIYIQNAGRSKILVCRYSLVKL